jgi:thiamine biosynthesis lipoprotein
MNTGVEVILCVHPDQVESGEDALKRTQLLFKFAEETLSRFIPQSELSRLNLSAGSWFKASPVLFAIVRESLEAARFTGGIFDPTILPGLLAAGYDRSFEKLSGRPDLPRFRYPDTKPRWQDIGLDEKSSRIYLPAGCSLDLGGIAKGWTVDKAGDGLGNFPGFVIDGGGDIRVQGTGPDGLPWRVGVADPLAEGRLTTVLELDRGAICTSTTSRRKWALHGRLQHHLIDPRTGEPSRSGVISATVTAGSAARAEIIAKTALILGPEAGMRFLENEPGASGLLVLEDSRVLYSSGLKETVHAS